MQTNRRFELCKRGKLFTRLSINETLCVAVMRVIKHNWIVRRW